MLKKKNFRMRECANCGQLKQAAGYNLTSSPFFIDSHLTICKKCLSEWVKDTNGDWKAADLICQWANAPWRPEDFTRIYNTNPDDAMGVYLDMFSAPEYSEIKWRHYQEKWEAAIKENRETELHPVFNQKEIDGLKKKWGEDYGTDELYSLEDYYKEMERSYGFGDAVAMDNARKVAKLSLAIDKAIATGGAIDKLVGASDKIQKLAGFTSANARDEDNIETISELIMYYEKAGWQPNFHNDTPSDIVDLTMKDIQASNRRLWESESTLPDQVENRILHAQKIQETEAVSLWRFGGGR